jgi:hypothetical protein
VLASATGDFQSGSGGGKQAQQNVQNGLAIALAGRAKIFHFCKIINYK